MKLSHHTLALLPLALPITAQGTVTLNLAISSDEDSTTISVPFSTLFDASSTKSGVSIQVSTGNGVPIAQEKITCQCFRDPAGTQPLGETFNNVFPGTELSTEPVKIGSIFCADEEGVRKQMGSAGAAAAAAAAAGTQNQNQAQQEQPAAAAEQLQQTTTTTQPPASTTSSFTQPSTTAATSPTSTPTPAPAALASPSSSSSSSSNTPTAFLRFALSSDPSDDSSTQMPVPIDASIVLTSGTKKAFSVTLVSTSGVTQASQELVCQVFGDAEAQEPVERGFGVEEEVGLSGDVVGSVGCGFLGGGGFGGWVGLVGK
ncbi:MAG: hypothetical protein Q9219_005948 [cf. Caloplaca sp. 3 TL-2023]